jgi:hypothetical protein
VNGQPDKVRCLIMKTTTGPAIEMRIRKLFRQIPPQPVRAVKAGSLDFINPVFHFSHWFQSPSSLS